MPEENGAPRSTTGLYQLYDRTAQAAGGPIMAAKRPGPAIREFHAVLENKDTMPGRYPEQFELRYLGEQDETTGEIDAMIPPQTITTGGAWREQREAEEQRRQQNLGGIPMYPAEPAR